MSAQVAEQPASESPEKADWSKLIERAGKAQQWIAEHPDCVSNYFYLMASRNGQLVLFLGSMLPTDGPVHPAQSYFKGQPATKKTGTYEDEYEVIDENLGLIIRWSCRQSSPPAVSQTVVL